MPTNKNTLKQAAFEYLEKAFKAEEVRIEVVQAAVAIIQTPTKESN